MPVTPIILTQNIDFKGHGVTRKAGTVNLGIPQDNGTAKTIMLDQDNEMVSVTLQPGEWELYDEWISLQRINMGGDRGTSSLQLDQGNVLRVIGVLPHLTLIEPGSVEDAQKIIAWAQRWIEANGGAQ